MITTTRKSLMILKLLLLVAILESCESNQTKNSSTQLQEKSAENSQNAVFQPNTLFEQTHSNLCRNVLIDELVIINALLFYL